ncbi:UDP-2,3-diacylglucosamine diphosphatase [Methylomonas sp. SURF-2]|uniref:UDP-2,3-diacylglucosamine hydrolase n=1 Tax=Methylomonas subterranea TaxID=2952225 RepID=A0ABT1TNR7_9GAMM|nr:UDP-2,3-diacylglucosamine diphosphatase [Methylomonas sp. SURF-2]MCQ8106384.1 UDP-2,3-diacylglucosamine diphosphatase [Methylomonas sp. SURF-2]
MKKDILFISDLHLSLEKPEITRRFLNFLQHRAAQARSLYILGDLFDAWIGDDDNTPPNKTIKTALKALSDTGTAIFLLQGNRDFLLGQGFCAEAGISLLDEYAVIDLDGQPTLLTHGDLLCTDDLPYQAFRIKSRGHAWQNEVLSKPLWLRLLAARWYRLRSFWHKRKKSPDIMDVNQQTVIETLRRFNCLTLIHGHTHRPATHSLLVDASPARRMVLADWKKDSGECLCWNGRDFCRETL